MPSVPPPHGISPTTVTCRVYGELNDFLPRNRRGRQVAVGIDSHGSVKDTVESIGVPHPEIDLIVVNKQAVDFGRHLVDGDRVAVYPRFRSIELPVAARLGVPLPRPARFVADIHLGGLSAGLRLAGFDVLCVADDAEAASIAGETSRGLLTRDRNLLKRNAVRIGRWIRHTDPDAQLVETLEYFDLAGDVQPFTRCLRCNGVLQPVPKAEVADRLPPRTRTLFEDFHRCAVCGRLYWEGSHFERLRERLYVALSRVAGRTPQRSPD